MSGIITRFAGSLDSSGIPMQGYSGDGGPATNAELNQPQGIAVDSGNVYIADNYNHRIRKIDSSGIITTIAGTGAYGYSGDGLAATSSQLSYPYGITIYSGNLYIADTGNQRIRKIDSSGIITTLAGTGVGVFSGDGALATNAELSSPIGIAVDSGNVYISDNNNHRIRKIDSSGIIRTIAGTGTGGFSGDGELATNANLGSPRGITVDSSGNLYIADIGNRRIRKVDSSGIITTVAGTGVYGYSGDGGLATNAKLTRVDGITVDSLGNIYIPDYYFNVIRKVTSGIITTIAGIYIDDNDGGSIGGYSGDGGVATSAQFNRPTSVELDSSGNLYIADRYNSLIRKITFGPASEGPGAPCFLEGTQILCRIGDKEEYVPVESLTIGSLVKTLLHGYKKIAMIGKGPIENPGDTRRVQQRLYKLSTKNYRQLKEDLFITGCHSTLVKDLTEEQKELAIKEGERLFVTDKHYRLMACVDEKAEPWASEGTYTIWHFALEHDNEHMNYGVFANGGLLVETCCLFTLKNKSNFTFLN